MSDGSSASTSRRREGARPEKDPGVPTSKAKDTLRAKDTTTAQGGTGARGDAINASAKRHSRSEGRRRRSSDGGDIIVGDTARAKNSADDNRRKLEGIFGDSSGEDSRDDDSSGEEEAAGEHTASPSPRERGGRRRSSGSPGSGPRMRGSPDRLRSEEFSPRRKVVSRERQRPSKRQEDVSPPRRGKRHVGSAGPPSLSQTQHAASSLAVMGAGGSGSRRPRTRAELKEQGRMREWASFCRRKIYLSLDDLSREERPRVARKGAVTPFSLRLMKVEGWQVPSVLVERASVAGHGLRFSLSVSFYHAGSKRFYGDTFMGESLDEEDEERVEIVSEKRQHPSSASRKKDHRSKANNGRGKQGNGRRRGRGARGDEDEDDDDDEEQEMEVGTRHEELVYWYTRFEDPNCIAVVELVATIMDTVNGIQVGQYGCGWTFIQFFGPNEPEAVQHRDVYRGSPRNLLFFEQGDWGSVGETVIPGCSLWFTLSTWENLMKARHLFRPDEIVSATDVLPGMQTKQIALPDKPAKIGPFLGLRVEEEAAAPSRRGRLSEGRGRWSLLPARPRLAVCVEFRLSALRVIIPGREGYERDLLKSLGEDIPDQEIVKTTTHQHTLGFSSTQREVVTSSAGGVGGGKGEGRGGGGNRAKIVDRRAKIGFHNGHTLVLPHEWVETHLEETNEGDVLMLPEEVSSLNVDGYVAHPFFALVVLIEYTIRTRPKHSAGRGGGGRGKKGDPLSQARAELSHAALPVVVGMQVFLPHDGKRLRLRNTPRDEESMDIGLRLAADKNVRLITTDLVYTNKDHLLDEAHGGASDGEDGRGPKMVFFDLKAYDSHGKMLEDETPASGDESPLEGGWEPPKETIVESSDGTTSSSIDDSTSSESSEESSDTESDAPPATKPKRTPPRRPRVAKPKPSKVKHKRPARQESTSDGSSSESTNPSLVQGDSDASFLRRPKPTRKRHVHVQATEKGWDGWRKNVKVPRRRESLMGQTLQAPLHAEASAQTAITSDHEPDLGFYRPEAVVVGGFAPLAEGLSRASRTRLSRHGFTDVMKDTVDSYAETGGNTAGQQQIPIDLDLEATDPLAKHEITLQFAAFRAPPCAGRRRSSGSREEGERGGGGEDGETSMPTSFYFTYQFYTCLPTRTERMLLRPDGQRDRLYQAEGGGATCLNILVREGRYGRDEPSLGLRHSIDTTVMQPFEAKAFATYMAGSTLFVDVWDADALMHVGTLALPLRMLMRQQKGVVKTAMEYEVVASTAAAEDCGSGGGVAVKHGMVGKGPVVGMVQILASNYGEPGRGGDLPASGAVPGTVHPLLAGPNIRGDWRMASGPTAGAHGPTKRGTRPRHKVRARPLSDTNPEISKYMEAVAGPSAGVGGIASLARRGRGDVDADSMGYDELMLLVRRFRGSAKGAVWYSGPLLKLLDIPGYKQLEQILVKAVERSERSGLGLAEAFREMDQHRTGEISTHDLEEMFWGMLSPGEMARNHLKTVVKRIDPGETGKVGLRELVTFIHTRQGGGKGNAGKTAETGLRRALARAELGGNSVEEAFLRVDERGEDSVSHAEFWKAVRSLGDVPGMVKADLDPLLRRFDTAGNGRISLSALMHWAGRNFLPCAGVENVARKKIFSAEATASRQGQKVSIQEAFSAAGNLAGALKALGNVHLTSREMSVLRRRFEKGTGQGLDVPATLLFFGRDESQSLFPDSAGPPNNEDSHKDEMETEEELRQKRRQAQEEEERSVSDVERKLKSIVLKAESMGTSLAEVFGVFDKDGSGFITAAELEEGLRELRVFDTVPKDQVLSLVRKLKKNSSGSSLAADKASSSPEKRVPNEGADDDVGGLLVSAEEFVRFVGGEYEAAEAAQGRLRKVLTLAEEKEDVTLESAFGALDKNGTGSISVADLEEGLRQLNVFDGMSKEQARLATRRFDHNGDGTVSLPEFLAFVGRPYAANDRPLEAKLRRVLLKAESMGVSMEEAFQHFDKDGCGSITTQGFSTGLREMGVFQEFSEEEVEQLEVLRRATERRHKQVVSSFGADGDGAVSLPKFLRFLGKEYGRGGKRGGGGGIGHGLAKRLRLILKKAHELGTPLSASFEGFGADESGQVSAQQLHSALKEIGQFRWTTVGEVKSFVRLLHDDDAGDSSTVSPEGTIPPKSRASTQDLVPAREMFLTLPALEAFVEGGDAFLAKKERAALARQHSRDASSLDHNRLAQTESTENKGEGTPAGDEHMRCRGISRASSWTAAEGSEPSAGGGSATEDGEAKEKALLEKLMAILALVPHGESKQASGGGDGHGVRGHFESFDVDSDGVLSVEEFIAALRSLGARGGKFRGRTGVETLVSRFRDGRTSTADTQNGASIVKIAWWFDELSKAGGKAHDAIDPMRGNIDKGGGSRSAKEHEHSLRTDNSAAGETLRRAVRLAEAKGTTLERAFARLDEDGDGFITLRQLLRGLDQLGVFEQASRDDVLDALDVLDAEARASRPRKGRQEEESKDNGEVNSTGVDLVAFIRLMRQKPIPAPETGEEKGNEDGVSQIKRDEAPYEFSLDPDTKAAEKKLRRVVAKQARRGVDVEGVFRRYDPEQTGSVLRSDFVQAVMQLGIGLLESSASRHPSNFANATGHADPVRRRQLGQLARAKGPVERRLMRMRQSRRSLFDGGGVARSGETKGDDGNAAAFEEGDESLALIQWYREGQKKSMVRHILATSLTTEYNIFFAFASPLFFEHPLRNPFNHEERFRIDLDDHQLRVVTGTTEWAYLRRNIPPCVGEIGDTPLESEFFDIDPQRGVQVTLMAHEVVFIPFAFLSLEPRRPAPLTSTSSRKTRPSGRGGAAGDGGRGDNAAGEGGAGMAERSVAVAFVSASHGHVVSVVQVHLQRRPFAVNRTFRFFQNEGEILKRSIQLLPGGEPRPNFSKRVKTSARVGGASRDPLGLSDVGSAKYIHCVEEASPDRDDGDGGSGVVIEWARRAVVESEARGCADVQEVLVKCRVGQFPSQKSFYLLVYNDHFQGSLYETWHVIVQARLRMDVHSLLGQQSPTDLVVRGDRYTRKVKAFSSAPAEVSFEPANAFQLVPGAYNRVGVRFRPLSIGSRKIHVHLVDMDSTEIVGAWLATATAMPPVVTKSYEVDLPRDRACHKRIAYANPWSSTRLFRLASSDPKILRPRYESLEVSGGGTGFLRLWFAAPEGVSARKEAFLFVNDSEGQNEECLLIRMRGV